MTLDSPCYHRPQQMAKRARRLTALRFPIELFDALSTVKKRDGIGITEQVEKAVRVALRKQGIWIRDEPRRVLRRSAKRASTRRRS